MPLERVGLEEDRTLCKVALINPADRCQIHAYGDPMDTFTITELGPTEYHCLTCGYVKLILHRPGQRRLPRWWECPNGCNSHLSKLSTHPRRG